MSFLLKKPQKIVDNADGLVYFFVASLYIGPDIDQILSVLVNGQGFFHLGGKLFMLRGNNIGHDTADTVKDLYRRVLIPAGQGP